MLVLFGYVKQNSGSTKQNYFDLDDILPSILRPRPTEDINELTSAAFNRILTAVDVSFQGKLNVIDVLRVRMITNNVC